jgi:hypothetical protein
VLDLHGRIDQVECLSCGAVSPRERHQQRLRALNAEWASSIEPLLPSEVRARTELARSARRALPLSRREGTASAADARIDPTQHPKAASSLTSHDWRTSHGCIEPNIT